MATALPAVDFGFRPIRPEELGEEGDERMDVGAQTRDPRVSVNAEATMETDEEDLCFADEETLPDARSTRRSTGSTSSRRSARCPARSSGRPGASCATRTRTSRRPGARAHGVRDGARPRDRAAHEVPRDAHRVDPGGVRGLRLRAHHRGPRGAVHGTRRARFFCLCAKRSRHAIFPASDQGRPPAAQARARRFYTRGTRPDLIRAPRLPFPPPSGSQDRVLSKVNVPKTSLQLVAMCCLEVAGA